MSRFWPLVAANLYRIGLVASTVPSLTTSRSNAGWIVSAALASVELPLGILSVGIVGLLKSICLGGVVAVCSDGLLRKK